MTFRGSNGVAFGPDGRLYVAQFLAGVISAVDLATGDVEEIVTARDPVRSPDDLAFGPDGSMFVTDLVPGRVWRRTPDGEYTLVTADVRLPNGIAFVGDRLFVNEMIPGGRILELFPYAGVEPAVLATGLAMGNAMQVGPDGHLYYPHMITGEILRVSPDGGTPEPVATVPDPVAVRFDRAGALVVVSRGEGGLVTRIDLHGDGSRHDSRTGVDALDNAAFDAENRMFLSSYASGGLIELTPDGRTRPIVPQRLAGPFGITIGPAGDPRTADHYRVTTHDDQALTTHTLLSGAHGIAASPTTGTLHVTSQYGTVRTDGRERVTGLDEPLGIAVGDRDVLYVAEAGAGRVLAVHPDDRVEVLAEGLERPAGIARGESGDLYVTEERGGYLTRLAGGDRVRVLTGLDGPQGLAFHGSVLLVVEAGARRLTVFDPATGEATEAVRDLPVQEPAGDDATALFSHGIPGMPRPFAGVAVTAGGEVYLSANRDGAVRRLTLPRTRRPEHTPR